jgi:hypothetical protein
LAVLQKSSKSATVDFFQLPKKFQRDSITIISKKKNEAINLIGMHKKRAASYPAIATGSICHLVYVTPGTCPPIR